MDPVLFSDAMGMIDEHFLAEAEAYHQARRIGWKKARSVAASMILMIILTSCLLLSLSPTVRASFWGWLRTLEYRIVRYTCSEESCYQENMSFGVGFLPDGYVYWSENVTEHTSAQTFNDSSNRLLIITAVKGSESTNLNLYFTNTTKMKQVIVNGSTADLYLSSTSYESSALVWYDSTWDRLFLVQGLLDEEILIKIAESIYPIHNSYENFAGE